jgi:hypothetical protein
VKDAFPFFEAFILTTHTPLARKKGKVPPAKKAKKCSAKKSLAEGSSQTKGLGILPAIPLDVLFEVKKNGFSHYPGAHAHKRWNSLDPLESHSQRLHQPV